MTQPTRQMLTTEMGAAEAEAARLLRVLVEAYIAFPTAANGRLVTLRLDSYQAAWMNGRKRPGTGPLAAVGDVLTRVGPPPSDLVDLLTRSE